jgi:hypothetical protein
MKQRHQRHITRTRLNILLVPEYFAFVAGNLKREIHQIDGFVVGKQLQNRNMGLLLIGYLNMEEGLVFVTGSLKSAEVFGGSLEDRFRNPASNSTTASSYQRLILLLRRTCILGLDVYYGISDSSELLVVVVRSQAASHVVTGGSLVP